MIAYDSHILRGHKRPSSHVDAECHGNDRQGSVWLRDAMKRF